MERGFVKLWRKSIDSGMLKNHKLWAFWCWCLIKAAHKERTAFIGAQQEGLLPGEFIFGRKAASEETGISEQSIRTLIKILKKSKNLTIKSTNKYSIISIVNWDIYQPQEEKSTSKSTTIQPASNQQVTTDKNVRIKEKNIYTSDFEIFWEVYPNKSCGKSNAFKDWNKLNGSKPETSVLVDAVKKQTQSAAWQKENGQFIPMATTWLNQKRWDAVLDQQKTPAQQTQQAPIYKEFKN